MVIKFTQNRCLIDYLSTISKIQNIDHSELIRLREVVEPCFCPNKMSWL
ncbi:hypothetical protein MUK42_24787 [Musa troglodytarum]|uniref:Uncharacterized protein n=1 Tax=Musa troglodytarum TaxID=320322 RepID=A0A9E7FAS7_9LILI|nr:hypothetical protein MUK42_24787 [Musa troglodytarum]